MNTEEMLAVRESVVPECLLQKREVIIKKEPKTLMQGPCNRCEEVKENEFKCTSYISPAAKWRVGDCNLASHLISQEDEKKFKNPLKASKQGQR